MKNGNDIATTNLKVHIAGVVLPPWFAGLIGVIAILSSVALILSLMANKELSREIRVLQLHVESVENLMIQSGIAQPRSFPPWQPNQPIQDPKQDPKLDP